MMSEKDTVLKVIGERLLMVQKRLNLLQKEFAQELEISGGSLSEIEAGNVKPSFEVYYNLTKKYNVDLNYLLLGTGEMFADEDAGTTDEVGLQNEFARFIDMFLDNFRASPLARSAMITHFTSYLLENEHLIEKNIKKTKNANKGGA